MSKLIHKLLRAQIQQNKLLARLLSTMQSGKYSEFESIPMQKANISDINPQQIKDKSVVWTGYTYSAVLDVLRKCAIVTGHTVLEIPLRQYETEAGIIRTLTQMSENDYVIIDCRDSYLVPDAFIVDVVTQNRAMIFIGKGPSTELIPLALPFVHYSVFGERIQDVPSALFSEGNFIHIHM